MKKSAPKTKSTSKVIGIGASAGGLDAIQNLFDNIPDNTGYSFVIIQHLSPDYKSLMPELLSKHTKMKIFTAEDKQKLEPNCIYLNQSATNLHVKGSVLFQLDKGPKTNLNLPVDIFFHTLGEEFGANAVGVVLSGTGSDGSRGIRTIKEKGGLILVQSPETAQFDGMPNSAIASGLADFIMSPKEMGEALKNYPDTKLEQIVKIESLEEIFFKILRELQRYSGIDFKLYKRNTLMRRLEKRVNINSLGSLKAYYELLLSDQEEVANLHQDFLINVTSFFRDKEAFDLINTTLLPKLTYNKEGTIRIWVPGCSTGEEAYSIAMAFDQYIILHQLNLDFKIFATDVDEAALTKAGTGVFRANIAEDLEVKYLEKYFIKTGDQLQVSKKIRDKIVFSRNDVLKDPPFIRMDLISCRNLLIYLENEAQNRVIQNFQFSLNSGGFLLLGNSESIGTDKEKEFDNLDRKWKLFQSKSNKRLSSNPGFSLDNLSNREERVFSRKALYKTGEVTFYKYLSDHYSPSLLFVDGDFNIQFIKGEAGKKLNPKEGVFQQNLMQMIEPSLAAIIRNGIRRVNTSNKPVVATDISLSKKDRGEVFDLTFSKAKLEDSSETFYIIAFGEDRTPDEPIKMQDLKDVDASAQRIEDLEYELKVKNDELRNLIEELETSNEELQSSNEELMASNEELQSTNEELQSVNEELYTVNSELQQKNKEVQEVYSDLSNLYSSQDIATLFLDKELRIRNYTPAIKTHLDLEESDIGRPIANFMFFDQDTRELLLKETKNTLESGKKFEKQIVEKDRHYSLRVLPFLNEEELEGVVVTLIDINQLVTAQRELAVSEKQYRDLVDNSLLGIGTFTAKEDSSGNLIDLIYKSVNPAYEEILGQRKEELIGTSIFDQPGSNEQHEGWIQWSGQIYQTKEPQTITSWVPSIEKHLKVTCFSITGREDELAYNFSDVTQEVQAATAIQDANDKLKISEKQYRNLFESANAGYSVTELVYNRKGRVVDQVHRKINKEFERILGVKAKDVLDQPLKVFGFSKEVEENFNQVAELIHQTKKPQSLDYYFETFEKHLQVQAFPAGQENMIGWAMFDVTAEKNAENAIREANEQLSSSENKYRSLFENISAGVALLRLVRDEDDQPVDIVYESVNQGYEQIIGLNRVDVVGKSIKDFSENPDEDKFWISWSAEILDKGTPQNVTNWVPNFEKYLRVYGYPSGIPEVIGYSFYDVTSEMEAAAAIEVSKNEAIRANNQKDLFLANMSHEIRTPMNAVVGFSKMLRNSKKSDEEKDQYLEQIETNSRQLLVLIDDILDLAKLESGGLQLNPENCDVRKLTEEVYSYYDNLLQKNDDGKSLKIQLKPPSPKKGLDTISVDPVRLRQIITNLINNAIKYSEKGTITVSFSYLKQKIKFSVKDEGVGIPADKQEVIFERLEQVSSNQQRTEGVGLGLSIVKGLLEAMGGSIKVKSVGGEGSTFTFTIPANYEQLSKTGKNSSSTPRKADVAISKVLIADDTPSVHLYFDSLLRDVDIEVLHAYDGEAAVQLYKENLDVGLILMDLKMPKMTGEEAFYEIRKLNPTIPIVAQSAFAMNDEIRKYKNIGFTEYLTKPIEEDKLMELLKT